MNVITREEWNDNILKEWDYEKNSLKPQDVKFGTKTYSWWKCEKGHSYSMRIDVKSKGAKCPICLGRKVLKGFNDAQTLYPEIVLNWDDSINDFQPDEVYVGSTKKAFFICSKGHKYEMTIRDFCRGYRCPICIGKIVKKGINDFAHLYPRLLKEWDFSKNAIQPDSINENYYKKVWWLGQCGHKWQASVYSRTKMNTNCPICAVERHASLSEKCVLYYIKKYGGFNAVYENYRSDAIKLELDVYIKDINTAIEYDGERWHQDINRDIEKDKLCCENNIRLIRIREYGCPQYEYLSDVIELTNNKTKGIEDGIVQLMKKLNIDDFVVDIEKDMSHILSMINFMVKENSIQTKYPKLAEEWHPSKNGNLRPIHTKEKSNKKVWWLGQCGHEWQATVYDRIDGDNCPYCSNHRVLAGFNDLMTTMPQLLKEWNYNKNKDIQPYEVTKASKKKVWWICINGHEWQATLSHRSKGRGCPYCSGRRILEGYNDLGTKNIQLVREWNYKKNTIQPSEVGCQSTKKVWWICHNCGYEWQARIDNRNNKRGCPKCHFKYWGDKK
ncbi:MAG: zinc-ribbon domain-containing protein [Lachnospiraceae bacterium]|nr:zinc-ribbon domain-containing protein [Lachnospiraceae bacterium]